MPRSILVVDDVADVAEGHARLLGDLGYDVTVETNPLRVEARLRDSPVDAVLLDIRMPRLDGIELLGRIRCRFPAVGVVMATVVDDVAHAVKATKRGAYNYLLKPLSAERLGEVLRALLEDKPPRVVDDPAFASYLTAEPQFVEIFERLACFAAADVPVLIEGETGTGKELAAEIVHRTSTRSDGAFVAVNVAALSKTLFESELFGHQQGAFTGATSSRDGYIEAAAGGTLLLDEIGELGSEQQASLLRVLQERRYTPVGDRISRPVRCRFVFSTNRDLARTEGFRRDLFYRLSPHRVVLPPLRERGDDVRLLADYFARKYAVQYGRPVEGFSPAAADALGCHDFPGNVRELEGIVSAAVLLSSGPLIEVSALPDHLAGAPACVRTRGTLDLARRREILRALAEHDGNQTRAAKQLGIARGTLNRWLREMREDETG